MRMNPPADRLFSTRQQAARLKRPVCCLVVDAEEDFDWTTPVQETDYSTDCMRRIADLQEVVSAYGIRPTYLLTYPVLEDTQAVGVLRRQHARGDCDMGLQLHPWVTPPFDEAAGTQASYLLNLDAATEERKLLALMAKFRACFGFDPTTFRAGRYGLSSATAGLLERHGFAIDTSLAPRTDFSAESGPDFSAYECEPFWFGEARKLLEVPLCRSVVGWSGALAPALYGASVKALPGHWHGPAVLSRLRCAERITLSPEGNDPAAMLRFLRHRLALGQTIFSLSFHSSSLAPGRNPYVRSRAELHAFYDRLSEVLDAMERRLGFGFAALGDLPAMLERCAA
jgi:predicted deacetylase